jgi:hypothetical protein
LATRDELIRAFKSLWPTGPDGTYETSEEERDRARALLAANHPEGRVALMADAGARADVAWLRSRGFAVCRIEPGQKRPTYHGWPTRSLEPWDFRPDGQVGILGGPLSAGIRPGHALVIVDLDSPDALALADHYLPATGMLEGRPGKPRSHRYYFVPVETIPPDRVSTAEQAAAAAIAATGHPGPAKVQFIDRETGAPAIDLIGTGAQAACPPSVHPSGERREWVGGRPGPAAVVPFPGLFAAVAALADRCGASAPQPRPAAKAATGGPTAGPDVQRRAVAYLAKMPGAASGQGGHAQTFRAARAVVYGFDLGPEVGYQLLAEHYNPRCEPPWGEKELRHKCRDADEVPYGKPRGWLLIGNPGPEPSGPAPEADAKGGQPEPRPFYKYASQLRKRDGNKKWLWHGYLSRGGATLFNALWKAGKTTLLAHLVRAFGDGSGEFCGRPIVPARVLYVTEEDEETWCERRDGLGLGDHVAFASRPFRAKPSRQQWEQFLGDLRHHVRDGKFDLVTIDTISKLWPVEDENDAAEVERALIPIWGILAEGPAVLLVHHNRKSDGQEFTGGRGSGAFAAFVETIVELRRYDPKNNKDTRRKITGGGRYEDTPAEWVVELQRDDAGPRYIGYDPDAGPLIGADGQAAPDPADWRTLLDAIIAGQPGATVEQVNAAIRAARGRGVKEKTLTDELDTRYRRAGTGKKGDPHRYYPAGPDSPPASSP